MARYHITKNGTPGVCHAQVGNCPLGDEGQHFATPEEAQTFADSDNINKFTEDRGQVNFRDKVNDIGTRLDKIDNLDSYKFSYEGDNVVHLDLSWNPDYFSEVSDSMSLKIDDDKITTVEFKPETFDNIEDLMKYIDD